MADSEQTQQALDALPKLEGAMPALFAARLLTEEQFENRLIDRLIQRFKQEGLVILQLVPETVSDVQTKEKLIKAVVNRVEDRGVIPAEAKEGPGYVPQRSDQGERDPSAAQGASSRPSVVPSGGIPGVGTRTGTVGSRKRG